MSRDRRRPLKVTVSSQERSEIENRAKSAGLSVAAFLRAAGLGMQPKSIYDLEAVDELAKLGADLGRLGGLLKLWLASKRGEGASALEVDCMLHDTRAIQSKMLELMGRV